MNELEFKRIAEEEWDTVPAHFARKIENLALLIEDEPNEQVREEEQLGPGETLLGLYHGVPLTERGADYGLGGTLPGTITLFRLPLLEEARALWLLHGEDDGYSFADAMREAVRETLWHEVGHYFGLSEQAVGERESEGTNAFPD